MLLFNRYEYNTQTDMIGKGGFSRVYRAVDKKLNRKVALKIYKTSDLAEKYSPIAEIQRVIEFDHPNVVRYIDIEEIEKEDAFGEKEKIQVCVMELLDGGNLTQYYQANKDLNILKKLLIDVLNGLSYLHQNGIIHRDMKPGNILIKNTIKGPVAKIADFGISKRSDASFNSTSSALIVSIPYMAPEQLNVQKYGIDEKISSNIDLWALGVAVYEIIAGEKLFKNHSHESSEQIMTNIMMPELPSKIHLIPQPFRQFVELCIVKNAKERVKSPEDLIPVLQKEYAGDQTDTGANNSSGESSVLPQDDLQAATNINEEFPTANATSIIELINVVPGAAHTFSKVSGEIPDTDDTTILSKEQAPVAEEADEHATQILPKSVLPSMPDEKDEDDATRIIPLKTLENVVDDSTVIFSKNSPAEKIDKSVADDDTRVLSQNDPGISDKITQEIEKPAPVPGTREKPVNLFNRYDYYPVSDFIGKGGFSRVYKAYDKKLNRWVALKIYKTGEFSDRYSPIAEIQRVVNLDHPNICRYLDIEEIEKENPFGENEITQICVMELLDSGNLAEYYRKHKDPDILKGLLRDVLNGLVYLHRHGIIHRDIKPANILIKSTLEGPVAKITDFGISKASDNINSNTSSALVVSIPYMAPEQLNIKRYGINEKVSYNLDLWALGVTVYEIITGKVLFKNSEQDSSEQIMTNIMSPDIPEKLQELPEPFRKIVSLCVVKYAGERVQKAEELLKYVEPGRDDKTPLSNLSGKPVEAVQKNKSVFVVEDEETARPAKKKKAAPVSSAPVSEKSFFRRHSYKIIAALLLLIIIPVSLFMYFKKDNAAQIQDNISAKKDTGKTNVDPVTTIPPKKDSVTPPVTAAVNNKESEVVNEQKKKEETKTKKTVQDNPKENTGTPVIVSREATVRLTSSKTCSIVIDRPETRFHLPIPRLRPGEAVDVRLLPGTYTITATTLVNPPEEKSFRLPVREGAGKRSPIEIPWD